MSDHRIGKARILCLKCEGRTYVVDTQGDGENIFRWRACKCGVKFKTIETLAADVRPVKHSDERPKKRSGDAA